MGGKWMRYNEFLYVKQQHVQTIQCVWKRFEVEQTARERPRQTCTTRRARITTSCRSVRRRTARTRIKPRPSTAARRHRFWRSMTSPWCSLIPQSPRLSRTRSVRDQRKSRRTRQMRARRATKKGSTSEIARLKQAWSIASRCKNGYSKASMQVTILVQDIETGDSWKWARQDSGPLPLLKQAFDVLVTDDPQTLLQLPGASLAQVLSDLDRVQGIQKYCDAVTVATARAQAMQVVMVEQTQVRMSVCVTEWTRRHTKHASLRKK